MNELLSSLFLFNRGTPKTYLGRGWGAGNAFLVWSREVTSGMVPRQAKNLCAIVQTQARNIVQESSLSASSPHPRPWPCSAHEADDQTSATDGGSVAESEDS